MTWKNPQDDAAFFIGYLPTLPTTLAGFLGFVCLFFLIGAGLGAFALSSTQDDPGDGAFQWGTRFEQAGVLELRPYPVFRTVDAQSGEPRAYMVSGQGKRGVFAQARAHKDRAVTVRGVPLKRGDLTMIQVGAVTPLEGQPPPLARDAPVPLGRWRLTGEICDGKCYAGAMRPGRGLAHKACAELCLTGGIPPVFVSTGSVDGRNFFLLTDAAGKPVNDAVKDLLALYVELDGDVERLDDLLVFKADFDSVKVLR